MGLQTFDQIDKYMERKHPDNAEVVGARGTGNSSPTSGGKTNFKTTSRVPRAKETANQITKAPGYEELNEREKDLCLALTLQPNLYLELKKKLVSKASKQKLHRSVVIDLIDKEMTKDKAFVIYDFLVHFGVINVS